MKFTGFNPAGLAILVFLAELPCRGQFTYTTNNGTINITGYSHAVIIPDTINGLPVTSIGNSAFYNDTGLTSVTIPNSVTTIGFSAFGNCRRLTNVMLGNSITSIGAAAFINCTSLTNVTIPSHVTSLGGGAFEDCTNLTKVYFAGNPPYLGPSCPFGGCHATAYYLPGNTSWGPGSFCGLPTALWVLPNPVILNTGPSFGVKTNQFGFVISWATNVPVVVEAATNISNAPWSRIATNTLTNGSVYFSDPQWTNYPSRFYRIGSL